MSELHVDDQEHYSGVQEEADEKFGDDGLLHASQAVMLLEHGETLHEYFEQKVDWRAKEHGKTQKQR